jgi:hypothetical protein
MTKFVVLSALAMLGGFIALRIGRRRQRRALSAIENRLLESRVERPTPSPADLRALPPPVGRYLRCVMAPGRHIAAVRLRQRGTLRTDVRGDRWLPFEAEQLIVPGACGFVWNAQVALASLVHIGVRDALVAGEGSGEVSLQSAWTIRSQRGLAEVTSGSLHRYLAEGLWCPTVLWPSEVLQWTAIDDSRALATLTADGTAVSLEFRFTDSGEVSSIYTPGRWGAFGDGYHQVAWGGRLDDYQSLAGVRIPMRAQVGWYVDGVWAPVWRGQVVEFTVEPR